MPLFGHAAIVGPPLFHTGWNDLVVEEVVAGRPDRMVIGRIPVVAEEGFQPVANDHIAQVMVEGCQRVPCWTQHVRAEEVSQLRHIGLIEF